MIVSPAAEKEKIEHRSYPSNDYLIKIVMIGDSGVGKSCLHSGFTDNLEYTIGVDIKVRTLKMDGKTIKVQLWDTAGQERFRTITRCYPLGAQGIFIVYDVTNRTSFLNLKYWMTEIEKYSAVKILIGNKIDSSNKVISSKEAKEYALSLGISFIETSAKTSDGVEEAFLLIIKQIKDQFPGESSITEDKLNLMEHPNRCC